MQDISYDRYKQEAINVIDDYLANRTSAKLASDWALRLIVSPDFEFLPKRMRYAVHLIFDLHDQGKPWCPSQDELQNCKMILQNESISLPPSFIEVKLKSRTMRGIRKEIQGLHNKIVKGDEMDNSGDN